MEVDPCFRMDEQVEGLKAALTPDWRGGVGCTVLQNGSVSIGDPVTIIDADLFDVSDDFHSCRTRRANRNTLQPSHPG